MSVRDNSLHMFLNDLKYIRAVGDKEIEELLQTIVSGCENPTKIQAAKNRLTEGMQHAILEMAQAKNAKEVALSDLIQEGNLALLTIIREYEQIALSSGSSECRSADFRRKVAMMAEQMMEEFLEAQKHEQTAHEELIARINVLQKVSQYLADQLKREPTITELAEMMKMTEEEIQNIMKETLAAMSLSPEAADAEEQGNVDELEDFASLVNRNLES